MFTGGTKIRYFQVKTGATLGNFCEKTVPSFAKVYNIWRHLRKPLKMFAEKPIFSKLFQNYTENTEPKQPRSDSQKFLFVYSWQGGKERRSGQYSQLSTRGMVGKKVLRPLPIHI